MPFMNREAIFNLHARRGGSKDYQIGKLQPVNNMLRTRIYIMTLNA